jgi:alpha-tubulin suppressor-like RCC1 family protein
MKLLTTGSSSLFILLALSSCVEMDALDAKQLGSTSNYTPVPPLTVANNVSPIGDSGVSKVVAGYQHVCAVLSSKLYCWGLNRNGQIGNGESGANGADPKMVFKPHEVFGSDITDVAVGYEHTCAIQSAQLKCWGSNQFAQLGLGTTVTETAQPTDVLAGVIQVVARGRYTCAVTRAGQLFCWGTRLAHHGADLEPRRISNLPKEIIASGVKKIALSATHMCAIVGASNALKCQGVNAAGEIGNGQENGLDVDSFYEVFASGVEQIALSDGRSCAVVSGVMKCFGASLGDRQVDSTPNGGWKVPSPVPYDAVFWTGVAPGKKVSASGTVLGSTDDLYYGSYYHMGGAPAVVANGIIDFAFSEGDLVGCMMFRNHQLKCWGSNQFGQLGIGSRSSIEPSITQAQDVVF